jgi:hypothetical protein
MWVVLPYPYYTTFTKTKSNKYTMDLLKDFYQKNHDCKFVHPPIPPGVDAFAWITTQSKTPYLPMLIDGPWKQILTEVQQLDHLFVAHRDDGQTQGWASLCLHGLGADKTDAASVYPEFRNIPESELPYGWTKIADLCPVATNYFKNQFPYQRYMRLRFMRLAPGGYIGPHNDGQSFSMSAVNISLNNPAECEMVLEGVGVVPFQDSGTVMAFNTSYNHMVINASNTPRYHMIVHGTWSHQWSSIMLQSYRAQLTV